MVFPVLETFARRLKEARVALRLDQVGFGELGGVAKNSQVNYEAGRTPPTVEYLLRLEEHGVDIGYVLTGRRSDATLPREHELLFELFGKLSARERQAVFELMSILAGATAPLEEIATQVRLGRQQLGAMAQSLHEPTPGFRSDRGDQG